MVGHTQGMKMLFSIWLLFVVQVHAQTVTRLHEFGDANPELVERQIRALIPEGPRVSMNPAARQVIVIATPEEQDRIAAMVKQLSRPPTELRFSIRVNQETTQVNVLSGAPFTLPVSSAPPAEIVQLGRSRLSPELENLPVVASAMLLHATLLRENPSLVRLRVTPAMVFGILKPYQVVQFDEVTQDVLVSDEKFLVLDEVLRTNSFYRNFLRTDAEPTLNPKPVGILLSLETGPAGETP